MGEQPGQPAARERREHTADAAPGERAAGATGPVPGPHAGRAGDALPGAPAGATPYREPFVPPLPMARWTVGLLFASAATAALALGVHLAELRQLFGVAFGASVSELERRAQAHTDAALLVLQASLLVTTATVFLFWLHQARANLRALGVRRPRYSRTWTVWGFLVPVLNLLRPYQVTREIWQASRPVNLDPLAWRGLPLPPALTAWWLAFVTWELLALLAGLAGAAAGAQLGRLRLAVGLTTCGDLAAIAAALLACGVVMRLSEDQQEKWEILCGASAGRARRRDARLARPAIG